MVHNKDGQYGSPAIHNLKCDQASNYKHTNYQQQHLQVHINVLGLRCPARGRETMPIIMERMAISIRKPCSRPICGCLGESLHLEA
jgi:hypothetical protein